MEKSAKNISVSPDLQPGGVKILKHAEREEILTNLLWNSGKPFGSLDDEH